MEGNKKTILLMTTGGTIVKTYSERDGNLANRPDEPLGEEVFRFLRLPNTCIQQIPVMSKDSLEMTDNDREVICDQIKLWQKQGDPIVILHGTDTMDKTLEYIDANVETQVPIIFTGAMRPMGLIGSDAIQNITESFMAAKILGPGVYLCFHNCIHKARKVKKNRQSMTFEDLN